MTLNEQGLSVMAKRIDELRELLRIELLRRNYFELPWNCAEADCPHFGKPLSRDGCTCVSDFERKHTAAVKKELGLCAIHLVRMRYWTQHLLVMAQACLFGKLLRWHRSPASLSANETP